MAAQTNFKNKLSASYFHWHLYCLCSLFLRDMRNRLLKEKIRKTGMLSLTKLL